MVTVLTLVFVALYLPAYAPSIHVGASGYMWVGMGYVLVKILIFRRPLLWVVSSNIYLLMVVT